MTRDIDLRPFVEEVVARTERVYAESSLPDTFSHDRAEEALRRDDFECQECGDSGWRDGDTTLLLTYKTPPRRVHPDKDEAAVDNLRTLCQSCLSKQDNPNPLVSAPPTTSRSEQLADSLEGLDKVMASTNPKAFILNNLGGVFFAYLFLSIIGGVVSTVMSGGFFDGLLTTALFPLFVVGWIVMNHPFLGMVVFLGVIYPVWFLLSEHKPLEAYHPRYGPRRIYVVLLGTVVFGFIALFASHAFGLATQEELGLLAAAVFGLSLFLGRFVEALAREDKTETILQAYMNSELNEYEKTHLEPDDLQGANYYPLLWVFLARTTVFAFGYSFLIAITHGTSGILGIAMLVVPVIALAYIVWRRYHFRSIPTLKFEQGEVTAASQRASNETPASGDDEVMAVSQAVEDKGVPTEPREQSSSRDDSQDDTGDEWGSSDFDPETGGVDDDSDERDDGDTGDGESDPFGVDEFDDGW